MPETILDKNTMRQAFGRFATGVTVVTTRDPETQVDIGMTCSSFSGVSLEPPLVLWSIQKSASTRTAYVVNGTYTVSVLTHAQADLAMRFASGEQHERFAGMDAPRSPHGNIIVPDSSAWFDCEIEQVIAAGDHDILLARVVSMSIAEDIEQTGLIFERSAFARGETLA